MYSNVFRDSISLYVISDGLTIMKKSSMLPISLVKILPLVLIVNEYYDNDGNRCYF